VDFERALTNFSYDKSLSLVPHKTFFFQVLQALTETLLELAKRLTTTKLTICDDNEELIL
jgi:hypothetical protein